MKTPVPKLAAIDVREVRKSHGVSGMALTTADSLYRVTGLRAGFEEGQSDETKKNGSGRPASPDDDRYRERAGATSLPLWSSRPELRVCRAAAASLMPRQPATFSRPSMACL